MLSPFRLVRDIVSLHVLLFFFGLKVGMGMSQCFGAGDSHASDICGSSF